MIGKQAEKYYNLKAHIETDLLYHNVYEHVFGADSIDRYTHEELITMIDEMYDCYKYVVDNIYSKGEHIK